MTLWLAHPLLLFVSVSSVPGSLEEINYALSTYGFPVLPVRNDGTCSVEDHKAWLKQRTIHEKEAASVIVSPQRFDVIFGRGKSATGHTGNLRAGYLIEMHRQAYEEAGKLAKTKISSKIVDMIHQSKGRFLKRQKGVWVEVSDEVARDKISHFFRNLRGKKTEKKAVTPKRKPKENDGNDAGSQVVPTPVVSSRPAAGQVVSSSHSTEPILVQKRARV